MVISHRRLFVIDLLCVCLRSLHCLDNVAQPGINLSQGGNPVIYHCPAAFDEFEQSYHGCLLFLSLLVCVQSKSARGKPEHLLFWTQTERRASQREEKISLRSFKGGQPCCLKLELDDVALTSIHLGLGGHAKVNKTPCTVNEFKKLYHLISP